MESDWSIEKVTGIRELENPDNQALESLLDENGRWLFVYISKGSLTCCRDGNCRKVGPGMLVLPSTQGYESLSVDAEFRGLLLTVPSYLVMSKNPKENVRLHIEAHKDPFRKLAPADAAIVKHYYSLIADLGPVNCFSYSGPEMIHLIQAFLMYLNKFYQCPGS